MTKLVTIATFDFPPEAEAMRLLLEAEGFEVFVTDDQFVGTNWFVTNAVGGAKIQVIDSKADLARKFVEQTRKNTREAALDKPDVTFDCEECGESLTFPSTRRGYVETCRHCQKFVDVPE
jgi:hypothetical protein